MIANLAYFFINTKKNRKKNKNISVLYVYYAWGAERGCAIFDTPSLQYLYSQSVAEVDSLDDVSAADDVDTRLEHLQVFDCTIVLDEDTLLGVDVDIGI